MSRKLKGLTEVRVVLQCTECVELIYNWGLESPPRFPKDLRKEYKQKGHIMQYCECEVRNMPFKIVGTRTTRFLAESGQQVLTYMDKADVLKHNRRKIKK